MGPVAVVGLGAMGSRIALRLLDAGHDVIVWNRSPRKLEALLARGATAAATPREAARHSHTVITMLAGPEALRSVSQGPDGIAAGTHPGLVVIEMSTVGPAAVEALATLLGPAVQVVDAPVLGSIGEADTGTLTIFAGGPADLVDQVRPLLATVGTVVHVGPRGTAAAAKLIANAALLGTIAVLGEALSLAGMLGLPQEAVAAVLQRTPLAEQARKRLPLIQAGVYPRRFALSLARKDTDLMLAPTPASGAGLPVLLAARHWLVTAEQQGLGDSDYTAMLATILGSSRAGDLTAPDRGNFDNGYDGLIIDLDGVVWLGGWPIDGVARALRNLRARGVRTLFLTNDPQHSRAAQAQRLSAIGVPATADDVLTAASATAAFLAGQERFAGARALVVGSDALRDEFAAAGFELLPPADAAAARIVIVGGHDRFDYGELRAATRAVGAGAELFATSRDPFYPAADGPEPATGAILAAIETATGATATITGKPESHIFAIARDRLASCARVAVVGDSLVADIAGARRAGLDAILVLSGTTSAADLERAGIQPDLVLTTLAQVENLPPAQA
ncbi:MAG: HAD-IIA family hydrolase [Streptosporangiaceae bacterium]